jgi:hypothetical protein
LLAQERRDNVSKITSLPVQYPDNTRGGRCFPSSVIRAQTHAIESPFARRKSGVLINAQPYGSTQASLAAAQHLQQSGRVAGVTFIDGGEMLAQDPGGTPLELLERHLCNLYELEYHRQSIASLFAPQKGQLRDLIIIDRFAKLAEVFSVPDLRWT